MKKHIKNICKWDEIKSWIASKIKTEYKKIINDVNKDSVRSKTYFLLLYYYD